MVMMIAKSVDLSQMSSARAHSIPFRLIPFRCVITRPAINLAAINLAIIRRDIAFLLEVRP